VTETYRKFVNHLQKKSANKLSGQHSHNMLSLLFKEDTHFSTSNKCLINILSVGLAINVGYDAEWRENMAADEILSRR